MEGKVLFKGKTLIILICLLALLAFLPVSASDNVTSGSCQDDGYVGCNVNQSVETPNQLGSTEVIDDNLTDSDLDDSLEESSVTYTWVPTQLHSDKFTQNTVDVQAGEKGRFFTVLLTSNDGNPLSGKLVKIGFNGVTYNVTTDVMGFAKVQINLAKAGAYTFAVGYLGDDRYDATFDVFTVKITKKPTSITANAKTFKAKAKTKKYTVALKTVKSANGKTYLKAGKKITLRLNGKTYSAKTNSKGQATFSLKITKKGKFKAAIKFAGDNVYKSYSKAAYITIKK